MPNAGHASGIGEAFAPRVQMKSNFWYNWAQIAVEHEQEAVAAREAAKLDWAEPASRNMGREMHAAMVAIVASALAFNALHGDVAPLVGREPDPRKANLSAAKAKLRPPQWTYMLDTFAVGVPEAPAWEGELGWLFGTRDSAVHFQGDFEDPVPHPELPTNVSPENVTFSAESATRAVDLLLRIFKAVFGSGSDRSPIEVWGNRSRHVLAELEGLRRGPG